jgi:hypothetical protein
MFALDGSSRDLDVTGADFYRLPGAALAQDEIDPFTGAIKLGEIGWSTRVPKMPRGRSMKSTKSQETIPKIQGLVRRLEANERKILLCHRSKRRVKFETGVSWITYKSAVRDSKRYSLPQKNNNNNG